jgi:predicted enzyme related to lactoylglutathione lyase
MQLLVNIDVDDLVKAEAFYTRALGLTVGRRFGPDGLELLGGGAPIYILVKARGSASHRGVARGERDYHRHWTPIHLDFVVDDVAAARDRCIAAGATLEADLASHAWGEIALLADPFGHGFCLLRFTAAGYDAIST